MKSKLCIALLWILVFLLGGVAGSVSYYLYREHINPLPQAKASRKSPEQIIDEMARFLNLDAQQKEQLTVIFDESLKRYRALNQEYRPQFRTIRNETDEKIKNILREDQKLRFQEWIKKYSPPQGKAGQTPPPPSK
jgi:uncharacterized membrane protein